MIVHKQGSQVVHRYAGLGVYDLVKAPFCVGAKPVYDGNTYATHRMWKYVTCKHCLRKRRKQQEGE